MLRFTSIFHFFVDFVNVVNYKFLMDKNKINTEKHSNTTNIQELSEHKSRGIYLRDDHCDWGSSGMNEFTEEFTQNN